MGTIRRFEEIEAWQTARELTKLIYQLSNDGTFGRDFGLRAQTYVAFDVDHIDQAQFEQLIGQAAKCSSQISRFMAYLDSQPSSRHIREDQVAYDVDMLEG